MSDRKPNIFAWILLGALLAVLAMAGLRTYIILQAGHSLTSVPLPDLLFKVMTLHVYALYGAIGGLGIGILEWIYLSIRNRQPAQAGSPGDFSDDPDAKIRSMRQERADRYLNARNQGAQAAGQGTAPPVEHFITALNGTLTYRVMAYRPLSEEEIKIAVKRALDDGTICEPAPGGTTTLVTNIGRSSTDDSPDQVQLDPRPT